jgi:hypothetical protein
LGNGEWEIRTCFSLEAAGRTIVVQEYEGSKKDKCIPPFIMTKHYAMKENG